MSRKVLFFCLFFISFNCFAQLLESDTNLLRIELSKHVNELRLSQGLNSLEFNDILRLAGENHSDYLLNVGKLKHNQEENPDLRTPQDRVRFYGGGHFKLVGENVLRTKKLRGNLSEDKLKKIAKSIFESWKNSPRHYKNMIHPGFEIADYGFKWDDNLKVIYATQVFGRAGIIIKGQLSTNAFGLKDGSYRYDASLEHLLNIITNMGNGLSIEGNKVKLYYHSDYYFNEIFSNENDGIAIDLVFKNQFTCEEENHLDASHIYDGVLLEPVYKKELIENNKAQNDHRIITTVGIIPDSLVGKAIDASMILIRKGKKRNYVIPSEVPSQAYELRPIEALFYDPPNAYLSNRGISKIQQLKYNFETNQSTPINYPIIESFPEQIHSIEIKSYSSVEGSTAYNMQLHNNRAKTIKKHLQEQLNISGTKISSSSKENWEKMYFQFRFLLRDYLAELSKDSIKQLIAKDKGLPSWDNLLFQQRKSSAIIYYFDELPDTASQRDLALLNLRTAVLQKNFNLANKAMFELSKTENDWEAIIYEPSLFEAFKTYPELVQNAAGLLSKTEQKDLRKITSFLDSWIPRKHKLSLEARRNLIHLYTITCRKLLRHWDYSSRGLSNIIHPDRIKEFRNGHIEEELELNLQLTFLDYFGQINDYIRISRSFDFITRFFKDKSLNLEDELDLALFFNNWSRYDLAIDLLVPMFEEGRLNEEGVFILLKTINFYSNQYPIRQYEKVVSDAVKLNQSRWCQWVNINFQAKRNERVKELYCKECENKTLLYKSQDPFAN